MYTRHFMIIDFIFLLFLALAVYKGYRNGFVIAIFSVVALFVGLAAAIKLSAVVAGWLGTHTGIGARLLPILAFVLVMVVVAWLVRLVGLAIQGALKIMMLGFMNRLAGIVLYALLYTLLLSVILFYAGHINLLEPQSVAASRTYPFLQPWGPGAIDFFASLVPFFKNMFQQLEQFFDDIAKKSVAA